MIGLFVFKLLLYLVMLEKRKTPHSYEIRGLLKINHHHTTPQLDLRADATMIII
jgi:hypothetical protein